MAFRTARTLLADPRRYHRRHSAADDAGDPVSPRDPRAVRWGVVGALGFALKPWWGRTNVAPAYTLLQRMPRAAFSVPLLTLEQRHGHVGVLALYDACVLACERLAAGAGDLAEAPAALPATTDPCSAVSPCGDLDCLEPWHREDGTPAPTRRAPRETARGRARVQTTPIHAPQLGLDL